jgi:chromosome segregation ATPase
MFSGLGSLSDLNNTFSQFTSNLTNLDSLQDGNTQQPSLIPQIVNNSSIDGQHSSDSIHRLEQKNVELSELLQAEQALVNDLKAYLTVKDELLQNKDAEVTGLTERIHVAERKLQEVTHSFEVFKAESEERINAATPTLVVPEPISPTKKSIAEKKVAKLTSTVENLTSELKFANDKISELETLFGPQMVSAQHVSEPLKDHKVENDLRNLVNEGSEALHAAEKQIKDLELQLAKTTNELITKNVTEAELRSLVLLHASEMSDANTRIDDLETQLSAAQDASAQTVDAPTLEVSAKQADVERLEGETQSYLNSIVELNEKNTDLLRKSAAAEEERAALAVKLQTLIDSSQHQSESAGSVNNELAQLSEACETKTRLLQESEVKVSTLTEKLKDMMHRFAELKSKSSFNAQQLEERIADITKLAQAKVTNNLESPRTAFLH